MSGVAFVSKWSHQQLPIQQESCHRQNNTSVFSLTISRLIIHLPHFCCMTFACFYSLAFLFFTFPLCLGRLQRGWDMSQFCHVSELDFGLASFTFGRLTDLGAWRPFLQNSRLFCSLQQPLTWCNPGSCCGSGVFWRLSNYSAIIPLFTVYL